MVDVQVAKNVGKGKSPEACEALFNKHQVYLSLAPEHQNETAFAAMAATQDQVGTLASEARLAGNHQRVSL